MTKKNPWDIPPTEPNGDADAVPIYHAVGVACTWFEILQTKLGWLFQALIQTDSIAVRRAYGTLESVPQKTQMAKHAAMSTLANYPELLSRTKALLSEIENFSFRRNDIVHAEVSVLISDGVNVGHYLMPGDHVTKKTLFPAVDGEWWNYRFTSAQINAFAQEFRRVGGAVEDLAREIKTTLHPPQLPASPDTSA